MIFFLYMVSISPGQTDVYIEISWDIQKQWNFIGNIIY